MSVTGIIVLCVVIFILLIVFVYYVPVGLWFQALVSGVHTSLIQLMFMRFRTVPPSVIVNNMINATKAGLKLSQNELEAHYLAGGNVTNVVQALISANKANMNLDFRTATAIDLAGRDVLVLREFEASLGGVNHVVDDDAGRYLTEAHEHQLDE